MQEHETKINCPACGRIMHKIYMNEQDITLDVCLDGCGGILFDNREYKMFPHPDDDITPLIKAYENKTFIEVNEKELRICPVCGMKMVKNYSDEKRTVMVDDCYRCGARFLDYKELEKIRNAPKAERYSKRPFAIPVKVYPELLNDADTSDDVAEINTPEYDENPASEYSAPLYVLDDGAMKKETAKKGGIIGIVVGLIISTIFNDKITAFYPLAEEANINTDNLNVSIIAIIFCTVICGLIGYIAGGYYYSKKTKPF